MVFRNTEQFKHIHLHHVSRTNAKVSRNIYIRFLELLHMVYRTTEQAKHMIVHPISRTTEKDKHIEMYIW